MEPCPYGTCDGGGFLIDEETNTARPCACRALRIAQRRSRGLRAVIPKRFADVSFDRPPVTALPPDRVRVARGFCDDVDGRLDAGKGLLVVGDVGTGKTTLAMLVARAALEARRSVAIYSAPRLVNAIRQTYADGATMSDEDLIERLVGVDLLQIDDLGAERTNEWVAEQIYAVVNGRYEAERSIVVTANVAYEGEGPELFEQVAEQLGAHLGARTTSRLMEMCDLLPLFGSDARRRDAGIDTGYLEALEKRVYG